VAEPVQAAPPARTVAPAPTPKPGPAPVAAPPEPQAPVKREFADECADMLVRAVNPLYEHQAGTPGGRARLARAGKACECIERVYAGLGITDLRCEDARRSYDEVARRHGLELQPAMSANLTECEQHAR